MRSWLREHIKGSFNSYCKRHSRFETLPSRNSKLECGVIIYQGLDNYQQETETSFGGYLQLLYILIRRSPCNSSSVIFQVAASVSEETAGIYFRISLQTGRLNL